MSTFIADMTMSIDGFVADKNDDPGPIFDWYRVGPVETPSANEEVGGYKTDEKSAEDLRDFTSQIAVLIAGRRLFDVANGWGGMHPVGCPVIVVSHSVPDGWPREGAPFHFVGSVEEAIDLAREIAGEKIVAVASPSITRQCLDRGVLDVLRVNIAPVLMGEGIPWFGKLANTPVMLEDPEVEPGLRVTHLTYRVPKSG